MVILAAALADQTREVLVELDVVTHLTPQAMESSARRRGIENLIRKLFKESEKFETHGTLPVKLMPDK